MLWKKDESESKEEENRTYCSQNKWRKPKKRSEYEKKSISRVYIHVIVVVNRFANIKTMSLSVIFNMTAKNLSSAIR
jgi:hypothetical protein